MWAVFFHKIVNVSQSNSTLPTRSVKILWRVRERNFSIKLMVKYSEGFFTDHFIELTKTIFWGTKQKHYVLPVIIEVVISPLSNIAFLQCFPSPTNVHLHVKWKCCKFVRKAALSALRGRLCRHTFHRIWDAFDVVYTTRNPQRKNIAHLLKTW